MQLTSLSLALTRAGFLSAFSPARLFALGEQGAWFDPSDLGSLWQDSVGTTPVTAVEQPVGLMLDKRKGLALGPELVTNGDFSSATGWALKPGATISGGALNINATGDIFEVAAQYVEIGSAYKWYRLRATCTNYVSGIVFVALGSAGTGTRIQISSNGTFEGIFFYFASPKLDIRAFGPGGTGVTQLTLDNISIRELPGNHAYQTTSTSRPVLSARYNLLTATEAIATSFLTTAATLTNNQGTTPSGAQASRLVPNTVNTSHGAYNTATFGPGTFTFSIEAKADGYPRLGLRVYDGTSYRIYVTVDLTTGLVVGSPTGTVTTTDLGGGWWKVSVQSVASTGNMGSVAGWVIESLPSGSTVQNSFSGDGTSGLLVSKVDVRLTNTGTSLPYQRVNTATDYDTTGFFPSGENFDGSDDYQTASSGGGSTTAFFWCSAIMVRKVGSTQTLFSDTGTNTGYRVRINASNQLELSAGNGSAYTTVATTATLAYGQIAVLTAWHDGTNLKVQIDNGTVHQTAFATASAGTASLTIGRDNGAASSYAGIRLFEKVYLKDSVPSAGDIAKTKTYVGATAGMTI